MTVQPGISVLLHERRDLLRNKQVGVFTNASGVLPDLASSVDALLHAADVRAIFSPEHGLHAAAGEGAHVGDELHRSGVPIYSLYGEHFAPSPEQLMDVNVIVCDLQDIGCRFYTYAWTLTKLIEAAGLHDIAVVVADRPNPLGGVAVAGPGVEPEYRSLVGLHDVPIRHGLTMGELAQLVNAEAEYGCDLTVVPCNGWRRTMRWAETGLPWVPPSPNMPTPDTALVYPGTCLLEGVNVSVGRGTAKPFEWLGAPWIDGGALAAALNDMQVPGVRWRPVAFVPCAPPYAGELCGGVQPHVTDTAAIDPVVAGVTLLATLHRMYAEQFMIHAAWNVAHFDRLAGSARLRRMIEADASLADIASSWPGYHQQFRDRVGPHLLYA
jgi:uncharacterized protein YbbC (DUF1343 family)